MDHDYRARVRAWLDARPGRSMRALARDAGVSASMLSRVLSGNRALDPDRAPVLADAMGLDAQESRVFVAEVTVWHGRSDTAREAARQFLERDAQLSTAVELPAAQGEARALGWPGIAVLEAVIAGGLPATQDLHTRLDPPASAADVLRAREALLAAGLITWEPHPDAPNRTLVAAFGTWFARLKDDAKKVVFDGLVADALDRASRAHRLRAASERAGGVITLTLPHAEWRALRNRCETFLMEVATLRSDDGEGPAWVDEPEVCEVVVHAHRLVRAAE